MEIFMKKIIIFFIFVFFIKDTVNAADFKVLGIRGDVSIRHGINEKWNTVCAGDTLKPDDTIESGKQSSATLLIDGSTQIIVPEMVIVDLSDFRSMSKEDLLMKLAMDNIRAIPTRDDNRELNIPRVTTVHGENREQKQNKIQLSIQTGVKQLNGSNVLFKNGFYATCALKTKQLFRSYPSLSEDLEARMLIAESFEKMNLNKEAVEEYTTVVDKSLQPELRLSLKKKIEFLNQKLKEY
jgi:hypothetical protein